MAFYAAGWLCAVGVVVLAAVAVSGRTSETSAGLPPLAETHLEVAARHAGCRLLGPRGAARERLIVTGPAQTRATPPGVYGRPQPAAALLAAIRRGIVVIQFRGRLANDALAALRTAQRIVPAGTILAPGIALPYSVTVIAYGHALGCARFTVRAIDALRLFRGRFLGIGPRGGG